MHIGVDIIEIARIKRAILRRSTFLEKIYTKREIAYCTQYHDPYPHYAARFAGKEALLKAFSTGLSGVQWHDMEILNAPSGKPEVYLSGKFPKAKIELSMSHCREYAVAFVVISYET